METQQGKMEKTPFQKTQKAFVLTQVLLRTMAFAATLSASLVMGTDKQSLNLYGFQLDAKYTYSLAFSFLVGANALACAYSVLSMVSVVILIFKSSYSHPRSYFFLFLLDMMMMGLVMGASSAATAIAYTGKNGNSHIGWAPICDQVGKFCNKVGASLVCSFAAFFFFFLLSVSSSIKQKPI